MLPREQGWTGEYAADPLTTRLRYPGALNESVTATDLYQRVLSRQWCVQNDTQKNPQTNLSSRSRTTSRSGCLSKSKLTTTKEGNWAFTCFCRLLRGFWARGRVRGDRSVFVTSHRPVHSSLALMFQPGSSFFISVQERYFLFAHLPPRCTSMSLIWSLPISLTLIIKVLLLEFEQVFFV